MDLFDVLGLSPELSYIGLGVASLLGSLIPFVPVPSFILLATMSVGDTFNLHALALIAAVTAAGSKQAVFYASYSGRRVISPEAKRRMLPFQRLVRRYGGAVTFVAASTPVPDDLVYIPLGLAKYNPRRFFAYTLSGKLVLSYAIVLIAHYFGAPIIEPFIEDLDERAAELAAGVIVFGASVAAVIIVLLRLDWARVLGRFFPWTLDDGRDGSA